MGDFVHNRPRRDVHASRAIQSLEDYVGSHILYG